MGQRFVINIYQNSVNEDYENVICSLYWHWDAYTIPALKDLRDTIYVIQNTNDGEDLRYNLLKWLEGNGGGISGTDKEYAEELFPNHSFKYANRNDGLIGLSKSCIENMNSWAESVARIYLDDEEWIFDCYDACNITSIYVNPDWYSHWFDWNEAVVERVNNGDDDIVDGCLKEIPDLSMDIGEGDFDGIDTLIDILSQSNSSLWRVDNDIVVKIYD